MIVNKGDKVKVELGFFKKRIEQGIVENITVWEGYDSDIEHTIVRLDSGKKIKVVTQNDSSFLQRNKIIEVLD